MRSKTNHASSHLINNSSIDDFALMSGRTSKLVGLQEIEGPALPPNFGEKPRKRSSKHTKSSSKKKRSRNIKDADAVGKESDIGAKNGTPVSNNAVTDSVVRETVDSDFNDMSKVVKLPPDLSRNDVTRSKWDSSANESENEGCLENVVHSPQNVVPHIVSGVVGGENLFKDRKHRRTDSRRHKKKKRSKGKKRKKRRTSDEENLWQEAATVPEHEISKRKHSIEISPERRKRGKWEDPSLNTYRLFQQARNVIQAEAQLAAMGHRKSNSHSISRSVKSSSCSRSRSRSFSRGRTGKRDNRSHNKHSHQKSRCFKSRSSSRSHRRSSSTSRRYSSLGSKSRSSTSRSSGRYSSSRMSSSHSSSKSSHSCTASSHSSNNDGGPVSSLYDIRDRDDNRDVIPTAVNIPRKVKVDATGIVATSTEKMIKSRVKSTDKGRMETDSLEDIDPYSEKSRQRNKMHKTLKQRDKEDTRVVEGPMTAANVRKAEKVKKQKKIKSEMLTWQPPIEYGEEEERSEDNTHVKKKVKIGNNQLDENSTQGMSPDTTNLEILASEEIDNMLSCGIETKTNHDQSSESAQKTRALYAKLFKQKLLEKEKNKDSNIADTTNQISDDKNSFVPVVEEVIPSNHENSSHLFENVRGFGKMPKYKPRSIPNKPKSSRRAEKKADLTSIWPEENGNSLQENSLKTVDRLAKMSPLARESTKITGNEKMSTVADKRTNPAIPISQPNKFRVQQPKLVKEEMVSSESDDDWVNSKIASLRKPITFNIKLLPPKTNQDENLRRDGKEEVRIENKQTKKTRKKKKRHRAKEEALSSLEKVALLLKRHRLKEQTSDKIKESVSTGEPVATSGLPSSSNALTSAPVSSVANSNTTDSASQQSNDTKRSEVNAVTAGRMPFPSNLYHNHNMSVHSRGFPMPHFPFGAMRMIQYPSLHLMSNVPLLPNCESFQPPLPKESFPVQPPEPEKERCKLSDKLISELFKKKNISADRLSTLLNKDENDKEMKVRSPNLSPRGRDQQRSRTYRMRRSLSSVSDSSRSSSRSRDKSTSSYDSDRSRRSYSSSSTGLNSDSDSDTYSHSSRCRHRRSRSHSSFTDYSRSSYYSRSRSRSRSSSYHRRSHRRRRSSSSDRYSYSSRSDYSYRRSSFRSPSGRSSRRRNSYCSDSDYSS